MYATGCFNCYFILQILSHLFGLVILFYISSLRHNGFSLVLSILVVIVFGPKVEAVTKEWGIFHTKDHCDFHCSPNIIRVVHQEE